MLVNVLLYGWDIFKKDTNNEIIRTTTTYLKSAKRFERPLIPYRKMPTFFNDS